MMKFTHQNIMENGKFVESYELPVKTVVCGENEDSFSWEDWQYGKL